MRPSVRQSPPGSPHGVPGSTAMLVAWPPTGIVHSRPLRMNPMRVLSGDQKSPAAPSVSGRGWASTRLSSRTHSDPLAEYTMR